MKKALSIQRRKWKRFKIKGSAIVMLHKERVIAIGQPKLIELGPVIDISIGGLAVQYLESKQRSGDATTLSISIPNGGIAVRDLDFRVITDKLMAKLPDGKIIHNRCLEFTHISPQKRYQLESFINHYAMHLKQDRRTGIDRRQYLDPRFDEDDFYQMYNRRSSLDRRKILALAE